jgi:hypothetical protein
MPLILSVDLTEIALFRDADETSGHRDLIHIGAADESSAIRRYSRWHRADRYWEVGFAPQFQDQMDGKMHDYMGVCQDQSDGRSDRFRSNKTLRTRS